MTMPIVRAKIDPPVSVHLASLGCAKNQVDSERILARLAAAGALVGAPAHEAEVILVNTCGFIDPAKEESIETILDLSRWKRTGRCRKLIVMGCLAQRYADTLREQLPEVDAVFGLGQEKRIVAACGLRSPKGDPGRLLLTPPHTAYLRISDGCDNRCAYCAIPMIRGPFRSRPAREVIGEANRLVEGGAREINVIGQDTTRYGTDLADGTRIQRLLAELSRIPKLRWLRLLYTHPAHFTPELIDAYADLPNLVPYVDLPIQHLNDDILRRMGRKVTQKRILDLIERLRARVPGVALRTALIIGFPGETRAQFNEMLRLVEEIKFDHLGAFEYSREEGTRAARFRDQVSARARSRRLREIMASQQRIAFNRNRRMKGKVMEILIERKAAEGRDVWIGRSTTQAPDVDSVTYVSGEACRPGEFLKARITGSRGYDLLAEPVVE
jgi:ribosomal protein S12 methylthiotransferase